MARRIDKAALLALLVSRLKDRLDSLTASQRATQEGATHPEGKSEHDKDTRAIEQQYLARGLAERVETLRDGVATLAALTPRDFGDADAVRSGALIGLRDEDDRELVYFLLPYGAGERVEIARGREAVVVTPQSPLGTSLLDARVGALLEVELPGGRHEVEVEWLR